MKTSVLRRILGYITPYKLLLALSLTCGIISVAVNLYIPVLIGKGVDNIVGFKNVDFEGLSRVIVQLLIFLLVGAVFQWLMTYFMNNIIYKTIKNIRKDAFEKLENVPLKYIDTHFHGDIISRVVTDVEQISDGLLQGFNQIFTGVITIVGTLFFMLKINISIAIIVVIITPVSLVVAYFIAKNSYKMFRLQSETRGEITGYIEEIIGNQAIVKAFGYEQKSQERFEEINSKLYRCGQKAQFFSSLSNPSTRFVNGLVYTSVGIFGAISVINGRFSVGNLSAFLAYANQYTKPFNEISGVVTELQNAFASAKRVFDIIDEEIEINDSPESLEIKTTDGNVDLRDVSFSYNEKVSLIENLNLAVKSGQRIAIVGPTGCGKTTLINLLMRFYDVNSGSICVDNNEIKKLKRNSLRSLYGMVLQETWLISGTIKENIAYGMPDATDEEIIAASKAAFSHGFIKRLPHGYDTVITEDGESISQGQKQLLCIARIMLTMPPMLILDEATSSIDTRTEIKIQKAFAKMMEGRTSFIVAHRLSTIKEADIILVMNKGKIIEQGSHEQLLQNKGFYFKLYNSQFSQA